MRNKIILVLGLIAFNPQIFGQKNIVWANQIIDFNDGFQQQSNSHKLAIGQPTFFEKAQLNDKIDPYFDGYILNYTKTNSKNFIKVLLPTEVNANQIAIGGIFNKGVIVSISIADKGGIEKIIFKETEKSSPEKFAHFFKKFDSQKVSFIKIIFNHSKINEWNLLKGIGVSADLQALEIKPNLENWASEINEKIKVGDNISSKDCFEFNPKIMPDGKRLYFVKECANHNDQDIWYSDLKDDKTWEEAKVAENPLNNSGHNYVASISLDGRFLVLGNIYNPDGSSGGEGVSVSHIQEDETYEMPKPLKIPDFKNNNDHSNFFMSSDEKVLIMAVEDNMSQGGLDLYASFYDSYLKIWSPPMNLGKNINAADNEDYPYLAPDGKTLFFSSKSYLGYGGHDIYMSKRLDETWKNWSNPVNLGSNVNSKADDKGFAITSSGNHAYYNTVNFDSDLHHMDIFKINLPKALNQTPQILVSGFIKDKTGNPVGATIKVKNEKGEMLQIIKSNPKNGKYKTSVMYGQKHQISAEATSYFVNSSLLTFNDNSDLELTKNIELVQYLDSGYTEILYDALFEPKTIKIKETEKYKLDKIAQNLIEQAQTKFEIAGHSEKLLKQKKNSDNSLAKAKAVYDYFISKGIRESRMILKTYGDTKPLYNNKNITEKVKNNRVEITYLTKNMY